MSSPKFFLISLFQLASLLAFGQQDADSLRAVLADGNIGPELRAHGHAHLGFLFFSDGKYDSAIVHCKRSLVFCPPESKELLGSNLSTLATAYSYLGQTDSAIYFNQQALPVFTALNDTARSAGIETNLSIAFKNLALYDKALEYAFRAITHQEQLGELKALASSYNNVSLVYSKINEYQNALKYGYLALKTRKSINYSSGVGQSYNNLGEVYIAARQYDSALVNLERSIAVKRSIDDRRTFGTTYANLGTVFFRLGRTHEAEKYLKESLKYRQEFNDKIGQASSYNHLARIALFYSDAAKADELLGNAAAILRETPAPEVLRENLELRIQSSELSRKFPLAVEYMRQLIAIKDSIMSDEKAQNLHAWQIRYETDKLGQQILLLEEQDALKSAQLETKQAMIYTLSGGLFLLVVVAGLVYTNFRTVKKGKLMQELFNRELNHRVKNNLQLLASVLSLQSQELTDETAAVAVKRNEGRVNAMALIHRKLYVTDGTRTVKMGGYINELVEFLLYSYTYREDQIRVRVEASDIELDVDKATPVGLILNELISNSLKYAFHCQDDPEIRVALKIQGQNELSLVVRDNGIGFTPSGNENMSFGLKMIHLLVKELRGNIRIEADEGTVVYITIPIK